MEERLAHSLQTNLTIGSLNFYQGGMFEHVNNLDTETERAGQHGYFTSLTEISF